MATGELQHTFQLLVEEHKKILYKVCHTYCSELDARDDLAQEIMVQLWRSFRNFDRRCKFSTWMYRIALNVAISFYRKESRRARHVISDEHLLLETPGKTEAQPENIQLVYQFIAGLDPLNKALMLLYLDENSYKEIADVLGLTETNVATKINRLKNKIKQEFEA